MIIPGSVLCSFDGNKYFDVTLSTLLALREIFSPGINNELMRPAKQVATCAAGGEA